jgi:hypothetical protein
MLDNLTQFVTILLALSIASERVVEIVKNLSGFLRNKNPSPRLEGLRVAAVHMLAVVSGWLTAWLALPWLRLQAPEVAGQGDGLLLVLGLGLLASGGSGLWNSVLDYLVGLKKVQQAQGDAAQAQAARTVARISSADFPQAPSASLAKIGLP